MNAKLVKKLRRIAEAATVGKPTGLYTWTRGSIHNAKGTTRAVYRHLKAALKKGELVRSNAVR